MALIPACAANSDSGDEQATDFAALEKESGTTWTDLREPESGSLSLLLPIGTPHALDGAAEDPGKAVVAFLLRHARVFEPAGALAIELASVTQGALRDTHLRLQQNVRGALVEGGEIHVHLNRNRSVDYVNGRYVSRLHDFDVTPRLSPLAAESASRVAFVSDRNGVDRAQVKTLEFPSLLVMFREQDGEPTLAYRSVVGLSTKDASTVYIDAATGRRHALLRQIDDSREQEHVYFRTSLTTRRSLARSPRGRQKTANS